MDDTRAYELARTLIAAHDEAACAACLAQLEAYLDAQLGGQPYATLLPEVARHLDSCVACAEAYALLYETRVADAALVAPPRIPAPNLSFLEAGALSAGERLRAALAGAVERAGARLSLSFTRPLLDLLASSAAAAPALRGEALTPLLDLTINQADEQLAQLRVSAYLAQGTDDSCDLRVQVQLRERDWPNLAGVSVAWLVGDARREERTDAWGEAVIAGVPRAALEAARLEVEPPEDQS